MDWCVDRPFTFGLLSDLTRLLTSLSLSSAKYATPKAKAITDDSSTKSNSKPGEPIEVLVLDD